jgi:hypothetical protein
MCGVETPQDKGVKDDFSIHVLKDVAICSNTFWILRFAQNDDAPAVFLLWGVVDHSTTLTRDATKTRARGIVGGAQREASIEGVRFRCKVQQTFSASHTPHAPKPTASGAAIEACVPIPQSSLVTFFQRK